jgi:O-antigen/teichoic acid export membrane protein
MVALLPSNLFSVAVLPALSAVQDNRDDFGKLAGRAFKSLAMMSLPMVIGGFLLARPIMALLFDPKFAPSGSVFTVMSIYIIFYYLMKVPVNILAIKHTNKLIRLYSGLFVANLCLNLLLIPRWGYMGGAYALVTCGILELTTGLWMVREYFVGLLTAAFVRSFGLCLLAALIMGAGIYMDTRIYWLLLGPVVYLLGLFLFKVLDESDWNSVRAILKIKKA